MKQHNKVKRLEARQKEFDRMIQVEPRLVGAFHRPGSLRRGI